jgi:N-acetyl-beta-hexosaminidase
VWAPINDACTVADFWVDTFLNFYLHDPLFNRTDITPAQAALVMGMSASQWGEQVDAANIQSRMWPRACAAAERMWSAMEERDTTAVFPRIEAMRCHMLQRGIGAGPVRPSDEVGYCALPKASRFNSPHNGWY